MRLDFFKKEKIIKYSIFVILAVVILVVVNIIENIGCHDYVDNLCSECTDIDDLANYIDYNMLEPLKKSL